jgi:hypothetical protein
MLGLAAFRESLSEAAPPAGLPPALEALWWDGKGDWDKAHARAMAIDDADGALVHAYLHRKEGDLPNAGYWYRRARRDVFVGALEAEWDALVSELLSNMR